MTADPYTTPPSPPPYTPTDPLTPASSEAPSSPSSFVSRQSGGHHDASNYEDSVYSPGPPESLTRHSIIVAGEVPATRRSYPESEDTTHPLMKPWAISRTLGTLFPAAALV